MVRKIKIVEVYTKPEANEEANHEPTTIDETQVIQANENTEPTVEPMMHEANDTEHEPEPPPPPETKSEEGEQSSPARKPKNKILNMPTTPKILQQVECQACKRKMSAKVLRYSHAKYCTERAKEEQPEAIPIPKLKIKNAEHLKEQTSLPVKNLGKAQIGRTATNLKLKRTVREPTQQRKKKQKQKRRQRQSRKRHPHKPRKLNNHFIQK